MLCPRITSRIVGAGCSRENPVTAVSTSRGARRSTIFFFAFFPGHYL
jgi:hypothetical protein